MFSRVDREHVPRQNRKYLFPRSRDSQGLEKITRLELPECKYGTDCQFC